MADEQEEKVVEATKEYKTFPEEGLEDVLGITPQEENDTGEEKAGSEEEQVEEETGETGESEDFEESDTDEETTDTDEEDGEDDESEEEESGEESDEDDTEGDSVSLSKEEHQALLDQINTLSGKKIEIPDEEAAPAEEEATPKLDLTAMTVKLDKPMFESEEQLDKVFSNVDEANKFVENVIATTQQALLRSLPQIVANTVEKRTSLNEAASDFYDKNPDLKQYNKFVGFVTNELAAKDPTQTLTKLLDDVAPEVRKRLKLKEKVVNKKKTKKGSNPAHVSKKKKGVNRKKTPKLDGLAAEVAELL